MDLDDSLPRIAPVLTSTQRRAAIAMLVHVFDMDPAWKRIVRWRLARALVLRVYYRRALRVALAEGRVDMVPGPDESPLALALWFHPRPAAGAADVWHLEAIVVAESARGQGLGGYLLRHALADLDARGAIATLDASTPDSQRLYERLGFTPTGPIPPWPWPRDLRMRREPRANDAGTAAP
ncbi:GNAT superfamily N-acetyltransferase [Mycetocola sp. BIGb0189]|uniref:GNAT family N-acetyltransferase n=1 Tax=Mycetocola sp. BIGb0189 TaxID=2940604 RepID=UPI0021687139|nr:GNAT family N-acetyltransferase [Mycetocola sp. BIGb0189]MCS4276657.1 GNAT superfamily N-acetyltransferase [Mycetocola sp. BIGb0189]